MLSVSLSLVRRGCRYCRTSRNVDEIGRSLKKNGMREETKMVLLLKLEVALEVAEAGRTGRRVAPSSLV